MGIQNNTEVTSLRNKIDNCFSCSDVRDGRILSKTRSEMLSLRTRKFLVIQALISDMHCSILSIVTDLCDDFMEIYNCVSSAYMTHDKP